MYPIKITPERMIMKTQLNSVKMAVLLGFGIAGLALANPPQTIGRGCNAISNNNSTVCTQQKQRYDDAVKARLKTENPTTLKEFNDSFLAVTLCVTRAQSECVDTFCKGRDVTTCLNTKLY
jgi:hypothetical protein